MGLNLPVSRKGY